MFQQNLLGTGVALNDYYPSDLLTFTKIPGSYTTLEGHLHTGVLLPVLCIGD